MSPRVAAFVDTDRLEHAVEVLRGHIDRNNVERERIRLALRALITQPRSREASREAMRTVVKLAREMNPDVP